MNIQSVALVCDHDKASEDLVSLEAAVCAAERDKASGVLNFKRQFVIH